jgi:hypothetical protein
MIFFPLCSPEIILISNDFKSKNASRLNLGIACIDQKSLPVYVNFKKSYLSLYMYTTSSYKGRILLDITKQDQVQVFRIQL